MGRCTISVKQYRGEIKRLSRHRGVTAMTPARFPSCCSSSFFFFPASVSVRRVRPSASLCVSRFTDPSARNGFLRGRDLGEIQLLFTWISRSSLSIFPFPLPPIRRRPRLIALRPPGGLRLLCYAPMWPVPANNPIAH